MKRLVKVGVEENKFTWKPNPDFAKAKLQKWVNFYFPRPTHKDFQSKYIADHFNEGRENRTETVDGDYVPIETAFWSSDRDYAISLADHIFPEADILYDELKVKYNIDSYIKYAEYMIDTYGVNSKEHESAEEDLKENLKKAAKEYNDIIDISWKNLKRKMPKPEY